ncbi:MAG: hypothetical protein IT429_11590 [Gemmataceae bacterium]|nr:hypothetical protein [Gemmataceae bacterium]
MNVSREELIAYSLGTLSARAQSRIEDALAGSEDLRLRLAALRQDLARLDQIPDPRPSRDLVAPVLERIAAGEGEEEAPRPRFAVSAFRLATVATMLLVMAGALVTALKAVRDDRYHGITQNNLKQLGLVMKMYSGENNGNYPPLAPYPGVWTFDLRALYPEYLSDVELLVSPKLPNARELRRQLQAALDAPVPDWETAMRIVARSYAYTGYVIRGDEDAEFLARQAEKRWPPTDPERAETIRGRLVLAREGVERFFITDINNPAATAAAHVMVPLVYEAPALRRSKPGPISVLYMDGHVATVHPGQGYPASPAAGRLLTAPASE